MGLIGRDNKGKVCASKSKIIKNVASPFVAKAFACKEAVLLGLELTVARVIIEEDALTVVKKMFVFLPR